jgi:hypothetical protein
MTMAFGIVLIIIGIALFTTGFIHGSITLLNKEYNAQLPNDTIQFTTPNSPYSVTFTNDYEIVNGSLIVHSYYTRNLFGKYRYINDELGSSEYTIYNK